jgi:hypothetical protein
VTVPFSFVLLLTAHRQLLTDYGVFVFAGDVAGDGFVGDALIAGEALAVGEAFAVGEALAAGDALGDGADFGDGDAVPFITGVAAPATTCH